nr:aminoacylase-1 [Quercus suber]
MKCVGMQYLEAIRKLKASGFQPLRSVYLSFVPDEEIGGHDGVEKFVDSDVFTNMNLGIVLDEGLASPSKDYRVFYAERSPCWLVIKATGQPGHGAKLYDNSAMENLFKSIESVRRFRASQFDLVKAGLKAEGEVVSINMAFLKAGTPSPTGFVMNLQPSEAQAGFDIRVPPTADPESLERRIAEEWAPASRNMTFEFKQKANVHDKFGKPLLTATDSSNPWWDLLEEAVRKANGKLGKPEIFPAATDSRYFRELGFPAIGFSPMASTPILLHDHNEFLNQDEYLKGVDVYVSIINAYASYVEHTRKEGSKDELHLVEQFLSLIQEVKFHVHVEKNVDKKGFWLVPFREDMVMNKLSLIDSPASQATLDELGVIDRIGPDAVSLHSVHGLHGSWEVSLIAEVGELIEQRRGGGGGCCHIARTNGDERE